MIPFGRTLSESFGSRPVPVQPYAAWPRDRLAQRVDDPHVPVYAMSSAQGHRGVRAGFGAVSDPMGDPRLVFRKALSSLLSKNGIRTFDAGSGTASVEPKLYEGASSSRIYLPLLTKDGARLISSFRSPGITTRLDPIVARSDGLAWYRLSASPDGARPSIEGWLSALDAEVVARAKASILSARGSFGADVRVSGPGFTYEGDVGGAVALGLIGLAAIVLRG